MDLAYAKTIITGDLVDSSDMSQPALERAKRVLATAADEIALLQKAPLHYSHHRGDGWQIALTRPEYTLRTMLLFRSVLRSLGESYDSYMAVATSSEASWPLIAGADLNQISGPAFKNSGRLLENIKAKTSSAYRWASHGGGQIHATISLADGLSFDWTPTQAKDISMLLRTNKNLTYTSLAQTLGKSRQSVKKSLDGARSDFFIKALTAIEEQVE
mgnify:CR=1 FL=1